MRGIRLFVIGIVLFGVVTLVVGQTRFVPAAIAQVKDPLAGAWEQTSAKSLSTGETTEPRKPPLHVIYADGQFVQFAASSDREKLDVPRARLGELTKEQLIDMLRMEGQYGSYKVTGQQLTRHIVSAAATRNEGRDLAAEFQIKGDELIITTDQQGTKTESRFKRLR